ncbi:MAG: hypothetical protein JNL82_07560 [Myxococcales bacterium]|nr:hypothetical protein [Myxococcales bacterium]
MTQLGEPAGAGAGSEPPKVWVGRVVEVTFKSRIAAVRSKATIAGPHWKYGEDVLDKWDLAEPLKLPRGPYSKRAAVYLVKDAGGAREVEVKVEVKKCENVSGTGKLVGKLGALVVEGACPLAAGTHTVAARITEPPEGIEHLRGSILWDMEAPGTAAWTMNQSFVELFFVLAAPIAAYTQGVWVEALRLVCQRGAVRGVKPDEQALAVAKITRYCHSDHGMRYDSQRGASHYGVSSRGGVFRLADYLNQKSQRINCYDQAGAVQVLAGAVGVAVTWVFLNPYGFIKGTHLVGVGPCNSPFYESAGTAQSVDPKDPKRTAFGNHAFVELAKVHDACAGPHVGTESRVEYVAAAIDADPALYRGGRPGTAADMVTFSGVTSVS